MVVVGLGAVVVVGLGAEVVVVVPTGWACSCPPPPPLGLLMAQWETLLQAVQVVVPSLLLQALTR